jgi:CubicO group peptidase (beta-lactamase class C family)
MLYSNQGYAIIGAMLEKLTGTPWETLITERLTRLSKKSPFPGRIEQTRLYNRRLEVRVLAMK